MVRVLLVDDSAVVRGALGRILEAESDIRVVTTAPNGKIALDALKHVEVDVVLLDVEMPEMDGLAALPRILSEHPGVRVIMASSLTQKGAAITMQALALGAVDFIAKPSARAGSASLASMAHEIVSKVRAIGRAARIDSLLSRTAKPVRAGLSVQAKPAVAKPAAHAPTILGGSAQEMPPRVLAVAASTGGPNALSEFLSGLPRDFSLPILVTQHMPPLFTGLLAQRLARDGGRPCAEACEGEAIRPGCTYVAPGDVHLTVATDEGKPLVRLTSTPPENHCRPAADVMLRSVAAIYGGSALVVILTGMGEDGRRGCEAVRSRGGRVIAQDEASSVVWGMPRAVVNAGLANWMLPLADISAKVRTLVARQDSSSLASVR